MDIGTEELSHLEVVGALARLHLKPMKFDRAAAESSAGHSRTEAGGMCAGRFTDQVEVDARDFVGIAQRSVRRIQQSSPAGEVAGGSPRAINPRPATRLSTLPANSSSSGAAQRIAALS